MFVQLVGAPSLRALFTGLKEPLQPWTEIANTGSMDIKILIEDQRLTVKTGQSNKDRKHPSI
jgi:hypothetical protein